MKNDEIVEELKLLKYNDKPLPLSIHEIEELEKYNDFEGLLDQLSSKKIEISIPPQNISFGSFPMIANQSTIIILNFFSFSPYLIALVLTILGAVWGEYLLLASIPVAFLVVLFNRFFKFFAIFFTIFSIYHFFFNVNISLGILGLLILYTAVSILFYRIFKTNHIVNQALSRSEIFCYLFYSRVIKIREMETGEIITAK